MKKVEEGFAAIDSLYRISSLVSKTDDPQEALELIMDEIVEVLGATSASIALINPDNNSLEIEVYRGLPSFSQELQLQLGQGVTGWVAFHGTPLLVKDVRKDARYVPVKDTIRSEMAVPMIEQGGVIGVVNVDSETLNAFNKDDLKLLTLLTDDATRVVSKLWLIKQLTRKASQLESLISMGQTLVSKLELGDLLDNITNEALNIMNCKVCALFMLSKNSKILTLRSMAGVSTNPEYEESLNLEDSAIGTVITHKKQVEVVDLSRTEEFHFISLAQKEGLISMLSSPITYENEVIGVLNAYTDRPHRFNDDEKKTFSTHASLSAVAIQNSRLYSRIFSSEELLRKNERLITLGLLAAEIAHEIRNPLTVIKLLFESLNLNYEAEDVRHKDTAIISEKLSQLDEIVTRVLSFSKSNHGLHSKINVGEIIQDTLHLLRLKLHQNKINLSFTIEENPLIIEGNKGQLQQVLLNLIINATEAMPKGGDIKINSFLENREDLALAVVEITDTGTGIPQEIQDIVFESFLSGRSEGSGLGLSIVKRILRSHHGDIELIKNSSSGTTMKLWLPLVSSDN
jgi:signal transduction histidine kinase